MQRQTPLIYLRGIVQGLYEAAWPVFIVEDHPDTLSFVVAIDDQIGAPVAWQVNDPAALTAWQQYVTAVVRQRLHQRGFRQRVLRAYQQCCAICRLHHEELLEAAHILPDDHPLGEPVIPLPTASRSASSTTPPSTATSSASRPTSKSPCASTSS
jgi:putative restriction endonuclease